MLKMAETLKEDAAHSSSTNCNNSNNIDANRRRWKTTKACNDTSSHKPQRGNINYKNKLRLNVILTSQQSPSTAAIVKMLLIYAVIFYTLNTPIGALARRPTSQELDDWEGEHTVDIRKQSELSPLGDIMESDSDQDQVEEEELRNAPREFAPRFKNSKNLLNIVSKPSGSSIQLSCPAIGIPEPNITWTRNGTTIVRTMGHLKKTKWAINMEDLLPDDSDVYMCKICNYLGCIDHSTKLIITERVYYKSTSQELGDWDDEHAIEVRKRSEQIPMDAMMEGGADQDQDEEEEVRNEPREFAPRFKNSKNLLNIYSKPSGSFIQLSCPAIGLPEPNITWTRNGTKIFRNMGRVKKTKWAINMEDLVPEDSDVYTCKICNYLGCIEHSTKLIITDRVNHKPIVLLAPANLTLPINGSGQMQCEYLSDLHSKKAWTFTPCNSSMGCSQNRTFLKEDVDILEFTNVTLQNEGWYTCIEMNGLGQSMNSAYLRVVNGSILEPNTTTVTKIIRSHAMWVGIVATVIILLLLLSTVFIVYVLRKLKHEKLLKQRIETVHQWTKKVIIYKPASGDSSGSMDTMIMPVVKIEKQRTTVLQSSNSEPAPFNEYEFPLDSTWEIPRSQLILGATLGEGAFGRVVMAEVNNSIVAVKMVKEGHTDDDIASLVREMEVMKIIGKHINIINLLGCCSQSGPLYVIVEFAPHGNLKDFLNKNRPHGAGTLKEYTESLHQHQQHPHPQPQHHLTEKHLISFAFQIARGMEYLASRRCIHRDLAARNVLVSDDYVMKIADFGLARDIQDTDYYRKNTNGRLPIKWMAPESLQDKFYDSQSDVWSYGILLWEIMTFGAQPYPTIMSAEELYSYLMSGQRMEKPPKCSLNIYMLMRQCWHFDASARPTFAEIVENLDKLLLANEDYLDVAVANLDTPPSSSDEESDEESLRYHYK